MSHQPSSRCIKFVFAKVRAYKKATESFNSWMLISYDLLEWTSSCREPCPSYLFFGSVKTPKSRFLAMLAGSHWYQNARVTFLSLSRTKDRLDRFFELQSAQLMKCNYNWLSLVTQSLLPQLRGHDTNARQH
jgi:hypothetical protein